ncbi:STAS domain-containing protein [Streptomyces sp. NPDC006622]|uniref:STAS domain-containing protein n=1 Tax=Streptomyces sp. NPDC006622 TaxID=3155459 RepID=UPI0033BF1C57
MSDNPQPNRPDQLSIEQSVVDGVRVVTVVGEIDHDVKNVLTEALLPLSGAVSPSRIVVDLSGVTFMDSSGINVLVGAHRAVSDTAGWLRIAGAQDSVLHVLRIVGIDEVISCHATLEQALSSP